jgi:hypothetical protein
MKRLFLSALVVLGSAGIASAQVAITAPPLISDRSNTAADFSETSAARMALLQPLAAADTFSALAFATAPPAPELATALALPLASADPADPKPEPKFLYGGRDDYRWQLGIAASWVRFRSKIFNASAVGIKTSVAYFTNDWFGLEGNITAVFAPPVAGNEHVKLVIYGGGPKIAWRQKNWEPWLHAIFGGAHLQPQTAANGKNTYAIQAGGGADYRWNPRLSFRLEADVIHTAFFNSSQNNFQLAGGLVFHF